MCCMYARYEVNWSNKQEATEPTKISNGPCDLGLWPFDLKMVCDTLWPHGLCVYLIWSESVKQGRSYRADKVKTSSDPCGVDLWLLSWKCGATHRPMIMCCKYAIYEVIRSNNEEALRGGHDKSFKLPAWPWPLAFCSRNGVRHIVTSRAVCISYGVNRWNWGGASVWPWPLTSHPENGAQHIVPSCVVCMPHMKWFSKIATELRSGHGKISNVVVVVNFISDRQYKNKDNLLTKQDTTLVIAVRGHQRSPWAHRAGGL